MSSKCFESFASPCTRLVLVSAVLLNLAILSQAQSATLSPPHTPPTASVKPTEHPRGQHEGIKVHGHWTIEVKNPGGKLVSRTEFENSLVLPYGAEALSFLLLGEDVPGGYRVALASDTTASTGPCTALTGGGPTACLLVGSLINPAPTTFRDQLCGFSGTTAPNQITATGPCYPLTISPSGTGGLITTGTAVATTTSSITDVFLYPILCSSSTGRPVAEGGGDLSPNTCAQGVGGASTFTHATLSTPVSITAVGQFIAVTVQLSFQ